MHKAAREIIEKLMPDLPDGARVLDVGSLDINGNIRDLFEHQAYMGLDITAGANVDVVAEPYDYPFEDEYFDLVVSANCLEHVPEPHRWARELRRILKKGGTLIVTAPHNIHYHNPPHYWNIRKDALAFLFAKLGVQALGENEKDSYIKAIKI